MRNLAHLAICLTLTLTFGCQNKEGANTETPESSSNQPSISKVVNQDSIKEVYARRMSTRGSEFPTQQVREVGKLYPVDEAPKDTSFFLFREDLIDAVHKKDIFFVTQMLDPNIKASFGDPEGIATFVAIWGLETPEKTQESQLWEVLDKVLKGGGVFRDNKTTFVAPYLFATFPDEYDSFTHGAITGQGVRMREGPGLNTRTLKTLSYDIVKVNDYSEKMDTIGGEVHPWVAIETLDGTKGHVFGQFVGDAIGFRAGFEKKGNNWKMVFLVAGD